MANRSSLLTSLLGLLTISLVVLLALNPQTSFQAALRGIQIWWDVVLPATLPFIVLSEILMGFGVVHFVGVLLEPLMRPLFNVPGTGGFVLTMGFSSGYPVAAKITTRLRQQNLVSRVEGERLVSMATTSDPLFVIGAVAIGFFHSEQLGYILAFSHYLSALLLGLFFRFYARNEPPSATPYKRERPLLLRALREMHRARVRDGRPLGRLMGEAVESALHTMLMIGGFIIVFSVVMELLKKVNLTQALETALIVLLGPLGFPEVFSHSLVIGLFEVTLGAQAVSSLSGQIALMWKAAVASAILSWGGLSVHAQVAGILSQTDLRVAPFFLARLLHATLSALLTIIAWRPLEQMLLADDAVPVFVAPQPVTSVPQYWWSYFHHSALMAMLLFAALAVASLLVRRAACKTHH